MKQVIYLSIALLLIGFVTNTEAQFPRIFSYQGMLMGSNGQPVPDGQYQLTFKIYDDANNLLWTEVNNQVFIGGGMFNAILGMVTPLNIPFDKPYFLGIQVGSDPELQPRIPLTSVAYALRAEDANQLMGISVSAIPEANKLLPLNASGKFPSSVISGSASGEFLKKNESDTSRGTSTSPMLLISNLGDGDGINGRSTNGIGVSGRSQNNDGIVGWSEHKDKTGVWGNNPEGTGVWGSSLNAIGIRATTESDQHAALAAGNEGAGPAIYAEGGTNGIAAVFRGNVQVQSLSTQATILELGEGLDYAEGFSLSDNCEITPGTVLIIDPDNPGKLKISHSAYDSKVAGIVAGANGLGSGVCLGSNQFDNKVALAGRVYCNVDASYGEVAPGDLLTTSTTPGYAMVVREYAKASGAILGKAMERLPAGTKGQILVLVTLQ